MSLRYRRLDRNSRGKYEKSIAALEELASYPLGDDQFKIDHGSNYYAFFDRMGDTVFHCMFDGDRVVAVAAAITRLLADTSGNEHRVVYLCDLKVHPDYRGQGIPLRMARRGFWRSVLTTRKYYAISMNKPGQSQNRVAKLLSHFRWLPMEATGPIDIFNLSAIDLKRMPSLEQFIGPYHFLSLTGIKDIVLQSTGKPMDLWHLQHGPCSSDIGEQDFGKQADRPSASGVHMICCQREDEIWSYLAQQGHRPDSSATIIHTGMKKFSWSFVLTSEI